MPVEFVPEVSGEGEGEDPVLLPLVIGLPADRRRRDSYAPSIKLLSRQTAPEAFLVRAGQLNPPRRVRVRPLAEASEEED